MKHRDKKGQLLRCWNVDSVRQAEAKLLRDKIQRSADRRASCEFGPRRERGWESNRRAQDGTE